MAAVAAGEAGWASAGRAGGSRGRALLSVRPSVLPQRTQTRCCAVPRPHALLCPPRSGESSVGVGSRPFSGSQPPGAGEAGQQGGFNAVAVCLESAALAAKRTVVPAERGSGHA